MVGERAVSNIFYNSSYSDVDDNGIDGIVRIKRG